MVIFDDCYSISYYYGFVNTFLNILFFVKCSVFIRRFELVAAAADKGALLTMIGILTPEGTGSDEDNIPMMNEGICFSGNTVLPRMPEPLLSAALK